jgi:hypothetical protein
VNYFEFGKGQALYCLLIGSQDTGQRVRWHLKVYHSEESRHIGILRQQREYPSEMLYTFELLLKVALGRAKLVPLIPGDRRMSQIRLRELHPPFKTDDEA